MLSVKSGEITTFNIMQTLLVDRKAKRVEVKGLSAR